MRYLLDTNIVSDLIRNPEGRVRHRIQRVGEGQICTSIIVAAELRYGAAKAESTALGVRVEGVLGRIEVAPFDRPAGAIYARIRRSLQQTGQPIGSNDLLIAAHALALGCTVVTDNEREFGRIRELPRENWLR